MSKIRIPELQQSLCGCTLETGAKIIGWLNLICGVATVAIAVLGNLFLAIVSDKAKNEVEDEDKQVFYDAVVLGAGVLMWFFCLFGIIQIMINLLLLKGVYEKKSNYVWPWIVSQLVFEVFNLTFELFQHTNWDKVDEKPEALAANIVFEILGILFSLYLIWIVYSFYRQLKRQNDDLPAYSAHNMYRV